MRRTSTARTYTYDDDACTSITTSMRLRARHPPSATHRLSLRRTLCAKPILSHVRVERPVRAPSHVCSFDDDATPLPPGPLDVAPLVQTDSFALALEIAEDLRSRSAASSCIPDEAGGWTDSDDDDDAAAGPSATSPGNGDDTTNTAQADVPEAQAPSSRPAARIISGGALRSATRLLPRVLILHTGGTLGMDPEEAFEEGLDYNLRPKTGLASTSYHGSLRPGDMLSSLLTMVPELARFANVDLQVLCNKDSSHMAPADWVMMARALHASRHHYDAFILLHGTDTMAYTAAALSLMLRGFKKPIIMTGSQLPLRAPRTDARQNLLDSMQCATSAFSPPHISLHEVAVCFGGRLLRGNRAQKVNSSSYQAFDSPTYPHLATLGIDVDWNERYLLRVEGAYKPRFKLDPRVIRIPIVPGMNPHGAYGDLMGRGVRGVVLEAFGVGNLPDLPSLGWLSWLRDQTAKGLQVYLASQCTAGPLHPALYKAGQMAAEMGVEAGPHMTPECAAVKMMFCLKHRDLALGIPIAGEL